MDVTDPASILASLSAQDLLHRRRAAQEDLLAGGVTFGVKGPDGNCAGHEVFDIEPLPRVIHVENWERLARGVEQRTRALDLFLDDVYSHDHLEDAGIVRAGKIDAATIAASPGFTTLGHSIPAGTTRVQVAGADIVDSGVTNGPAHWRILEDNVRMPSGLTFALAARLVTATHYPELIDAVSDQLTAVDGALEAFCATLRDAAPASDAPEQAHVVVLSEGEHDPTWAEQRVIAQTGGFHIRTLDQVGVDADDRGRPVLWDRVNQRVVDVVYLRVEEHRLPTGIGGPLSAGTLGMANAPGNGLADDKAVYASVPAMIRFYLDEEPALDQVPTWLCTDPVHRMEVLDRLDELVVKPVDGYGGAGITIGPECTGAELSRRRAEILADPARFIAQEKVRLSVLPALDGTERHVDLRMFSLLSRAGASTIPVGLTRVARAGSLIVNSSRGGGGRDTWIISGTLQS